MARQGIKASRQDGKASRDGKASAGQGIIIGIGIIGNCHHRHRQVMPSARHTIGMPSASAGRSSRTQDGRTQQSGAV